MAKSSYLSNVLKSIKYATIDTVAEMNPVIVEQYTENKDFVKETIDEIKQKAKSKKDSGNNYVKDTIKSTYKNLKEDLKSGNFYNKTRIEQEESKAMEKAFGMSFDFDTDFDMGDAFNENDDFNFDDDFGDTEESTSSSGSSSANDPFAARVMAAAMGQTTSAIKKSNSRTASALGGLMVETSKFNADVIAASTERMLTGVSVASGIIHNDLAAINTNLGNVVEFTNSALRTHIENSTTFFETQKQQMQEQTELLKEIRDIQASVYKPKDKRYSSGKVAISDIFGSEGSLDLKQYKQYLKENGGAGSSSDGGIIGMFAQFAPLVLASVTGSPLSVPLKGLVKKAIPKAIEESFKSINDTISGIISTSLVNLTQAQKGHNGGFFQMLGDMFGLRIPSLKINLSKYDKGPTAWTGKDHKALTEVIPTWLSKIYAGITGRGEQRYNYESGKFENLSDIKAAHDKDYKYAVARANQSINEELNKNLNKIKFSNDEDRKAIIDAIEKIQRYNFKEMKNFNPNSKRSRDLDPKTYGITGPNADKMMEIVRMLYANTDKKAQMKGSGELLSSISSYERGIRQQEAEGDSVYNALFNNSIDENKISNSPIMASAKRLDTTNEILQNILDVVSTQRTQTITTATSKVSVDGTPKDSTTSTDSSNTSSKKSEGFDLNTDDPKEIQKMLESEEAPEETKTYIQEIENGKTASQKLKAFFKGFAMLTKKPTAFLKSTLNTVDTYAYSLFFGDGESDVHTISDKLLKGFDNVFAKIGNSLSSTFKDIKAEIFSEGKTTAKGIFKAVFNVDLDQFAKEFKTAMFGDPNTPFFKGMGKVFKKGFGEIIHDVFGDIKDSIHDFFTPDDEDGQGFVGRNLDKMSDKYAEKKKKEKEAEERKEKGDQDIFEASAQSKEEDEKKKKQNKNKPISNAAAGLKVTRTGLVAVSEGERIVPKYANAASIAGRQLKENSAIAKFKKMMGFGSVASYAAGGTVGDEEGIVKQAGGITYSPSMTYKKFNEFYKALPDDNNREYYRKKFAQDFGERMVKEAKQKGAKTAQDAVDKAQDVIDQTIENNPALADEIKSRVSNIANSEFVSKARKYTREGVKGATSFAGAMGQEAKNAASSLKDAFTTGDDTTSKAFRDLGKRFSPNKEAKNAFDDVIKNWKNYLPKALAGGATGAAISALFGLAGGPLVGAAVGSATALITKSDAVQKLLFGEKEFDKNGNVKGRKGGLFSKEMSTNIEKYFPNMAKSATVGGILSVLPFVPGGPVSGILIGSAVGFARSNETMRETLFGKDAVVGKAVKYVKQRLPKMGLGATVGALAGPFGITTNLMIGAGLGLLSDTEKFKRMIFGTKDVDGNYRGGLVGNIKKVLAVPLEGLSGIIDDTREFFNNEIYEPLRKSAHIFFKQFQNMFIWIGDKIADSFTKRVWGPIGSIITNKFLVPLEKRIGGLFKGVLGIGKWSIKKVLSPITGLAGIAERSQLNSIGYGSGTAEERVLRRQQIVDEYQAKADNARFFKGRKQRKANKIRKKLMNSQSAIADNYISASTTTTEELEQALLVNNALGPVGALGGAKSAVKKFAKGVLKKTGLNDTLNAYVSDNLISNKYRKAILAEVEQGEWKKSVDLIMNHTPKLNQQTREKLCGVIKEAAKQVADGRKLAENATEERDKIEAKLGFKLGGHATARTLEEAIRARGGNVKNGKVVATGEDGEMPVPETPAEKFLSKISSDVHNIAEGFLKTHEKNLQPLSNEELAGMSKDELIEAGQFGILNGSRIDTTAGVKYTDQYEYTENGMVKMKRNDQGELIPDEQDSQTRETLKKKDDNDNTQKGILSKLTGIGSGIAEFFGKKKEKKKPNVFEKILSVLGMGFSFLGGGKLFTALKIAGLATGAAYILGKDTKVVKTDENGNEMHDEYGNPIYKTVGEVIGDKLSGIVTGIKNWVVTKAWPGIKNFFTEAFTNIKNWVINTAIPGITDWFKDAWPTIKKGFACVWDGFTAVSDKIVDWTIQKLLPAIIKKTPDILKSAGSTVLKMLGITKSDVDAESTETGNTGDSTDIGFKAATEQQASSSSSSSTTIMLDTNTTFDQDKLQVNFGTASSNNNSIVEAAKSNTSNAGISNNAVNSTITQNNALTGATNLTTDSNINTAIKKSDGYKKITNEQQKYKVLKSKKIKENWNTTYTLSDGSVHTLGELLTTPGYYLGETDTGSVYSDDLLKSPRLLYDFTGGTIDDVSITEEEREENTNHISRNPLDKTIHGVALAKFTKGQLPNVGLRSAEKINAIYHGAAQWSLAKIPFVGKYAALADKAVELGTYAPMKVTEIANNYYKNKAKGITGKAALKDSVSTAFKRKKTIRQKFKDATEKIFSKKAKETAEETVEDTVTNAAKDKFEDTITKVATDIDGTSTTKKSGILKKITSWLTDALTNSKFLSKIGEKINNAICTAKGFEKITNQKLESLMKKLISKISKHLGKKSSAIISKIGGKIAEALGTAGLEIVVTCIASLIIGMKNADALFGVETPTLPEMIIAGIANVINETLLFGILDIQNIIPIIENALDEIPGINLEDLKKRQAEMEAKVKAFNDERGTNYTPYEYLMQDKIETKINNFLHSRYMAGVTGTVEGGGQMLISGGLDFLKTVGYSVGGGVLAYGKSAVQSLSDGSSFSENNYKNIGNYKKKLNSYYDELSDTMREGAYTIKNGWEYTVTGVDPSASDSNHGGSGGSFGTSDSKNKDKKSSNSEKTVTHTSYNSLADAAGIANSANQYSYDSLIKNAQDKSLDLMASQYGLSKTDFTGETSDYENQANQNRQAVANLNSTWIKINNETTPFYDSITDAMSKANKAVSKNIAVALGLADAKDDDVDIVKIANDDKYLQKRSQTIQDNSTIASLFSGFTGSNSNSTKLQDAAALKVSQAAKNGKLTTSSDSAISRTTKTLVNSLKTSTGSSNKNISVNVSSAAPGAAAFGSGIKGNDIKDEVQNTPPSENEFVSQKYGKYANKTFGIGTQKEKVSDAGCAPSTAVMAINSNLGKKSKLTMEDALKHASGYIADNGGVTPDYFADEFRRYGFKTAYISKSDDKQKDVMKHQLMNGKSIVLMGRNTSNRSKKKSPFGPNYHYVVATGMSGDGKYVYISDPEAKTPNVKYAADEIFNNTDLSIVPVAANGRIAELAGRLRTNLKQLSGKKTSGIIFVGDSRTEGMRDAIGENDKTKFICKIGKGLAWLKSTAYSQLKDMCDKYPDYYVVFNFGINDLGVESYISYYKDTIAKNIKNKIIHMSINPIDADKAKKAGYQVTTSDIENFNKRYKEYAGSAYLDTYSYLKSNGFSASDGIHYNNDTYKKIYNKTVDFINGNGGKITAGVASGADSVSDTASSGTTTSSGKHIKSFSDLISAIGSILSGTWGLSSSESADLSGSSSSSTLDGTSTISTDGVSGRVSSDPKVAKLQKQLVAQMDSIKGTLNYSQSQRDPETGSGDCSSTVQWAYQKVTGKDIGSWTGAQNESNATTFIEQPHAQSFWDESKLQLGDILLYGNDAGGHVEMYHGNGTTIGHGGGMGPKIKNIDYRTSDCWSAKRLNEFMPSGKGTGLFISQKDSKYRSKRIGDETVEQAGCAPAVATMAIDNTKEYNMDKAIKDAKQYKNDGEGVTADYFINTFKKQGYNTIVLTSKKKIIKALKQGNNAVLIGQDANNKSKRRSPFGPNSHYVLATGISRDEKIIYINDPENNRPNIEYDANAVLNAVKVAIVPVHSKGGKLDRYNEQLSKALKNYKGKAVNVALSPILAALSSMESTRAADVKTRKKKWVYAANQKNLINKTFSAERVSTAKTYHANGPYLVLWALRNKGIVGQDTGELTVSGGYLSGSAANAVKEKCNAYQYSNNQDVYALISAGKIKPGDIVILNNRILVYAGGQNWYCGDKVGAVVDANGEYKSWYITGKSFKGSKPSAVYRLKSVDTSIANKNNATNGTSSVTDAVASTADTIDGTSSDSTTAGSEDTILDKLVKSFALLAEGWGLTSGDTETVDTSSGSSSSSDGSSTSVRGDSVKAKIWNYFHDKGIPDNGIAGAMGNIQSESDFTLDSIESCYKADIQKAYADDVSSGKISRSGFLGKATYNGKTYGPGYGLVQWTDDSRKGGMYDNTVGKGMRIDSAQGQLDVLWSELNSYYQKSLNAMKTGTVRTATETFMTDYERPADQSQSAKDGRVANAEAILKEMTGKGSGLSSIGINGKAGKAIASINTANSVNKAKDNARISKLLNSNSGLTSIGVNGRAGNAIASINRNGSKPSNTPKLSFGDLVGKGSGVDLSSTVKSVSSSKVTRSYSTDTSSSDVNTLLGAIIKLLAQAVDNTASIQSIADAVVTLVDTKAANVTDVETKKQLLDTKAQMLNLIRQQNTNNASTSLSDLISDMEAITSR